MLRRLRRWSVRAPRVILALALVAFVAPAVAGPLAYCLRGDDAPRVVAAASHCETLAKSPGAMHLPAADEAVGTGAAGAAGAAMPTPAQGVVLFASVGGFWPPSSDLLPIRRDAYGGASPERASTSSLAGAIAGRSVRLLI